MNTTTLARFIKLVGPNALVGLSSPELSDDIFLPANLLSMNLSVELLDLSTYPDRWLTQLHESELILVHDCGGVYVTYDYINKPVVTLLNPVFPYSTKAVFNIIKTRLGTELLTNIYDIIQDNIEQDFQIEMVCRGLYLGKPVSLDEAESVALELINKHASYKTLRKLL